MLFVISIVQPAGPLLAANATTTEPGTDAAAATSTESAPAADVSERSAPSGDTDSTSTDVEAAPEDDTDRSAETPSLLENTTENPTTTASTSTTDSEETSRTDTSTASSTADPTNDGHSSVERSTSTTENTATTTGTSTVSNTGSTTGTSTNTIEDGGANKATSSPTASSTTASTSAGSAFGSSTEGTMDATSTSSTGTATTTTDEVDANSTTTELGTDDDVTTPNPAPEPTAGTGDQEAAAVASAATSSDDVASSSGPAPATEQTAVYNNENKYQFSITECVPAGDGSFYCSEASPEGRVRGADRVFAAPDDDGDREIFIETNGELTQLTHNTTEDNAPHFDEYSDTILWHRLVNGRYQIMSYDLVTGEETQLTDSRVNNMEPTRYGDTIVWQTWDGGDWDIVMEDGDDRRTLTDNNTHDITPSINGDHIVWQSFNGARWLVTVYDRRNGTTEIIEDTNGGSVENPRFVLVYDTKFDTGDIETKGYDLKSGEVVTLDSRPAPVPLDIPEPDGTKEEKALVQPAPQLKSKTEDEADDMDADDGLDLDAPIDPVATGTEDIIVTPYVEESTSTSPKVEESQATSTPTDVVIPPPNEPTSDKPTTSVDSQSSVATST